MLELFDVSYEELNGVRSDELYRLRKKRSVTGWDGMLSATKTWSLTSLIILIHVTS